MIFETHAHYDDSRYDIDRQELLSKELKKSGIDKIMNVASDIPSIDATYRLSLDYPDVYGALGLHPSEIKDLSDEVISYIKELTSKNKKIRAVGEIGLDYHYEGYDIEEQKRGFVRQIDLAEELDLPIIVHSRDAAFDTFSIIQNRYSDKRYRLNGVIHCFSYSKEEAMKYTELGFLIGVGGVVTYKNGKKLKEVVNEIPLEKIILETDCPYLSPEPLRGERNSSLNLKYIVTSVARIKGVSEEEVERITYNTAIRLYGIK